jgi:hypothetical protein
MPFTKPCNSMNFQRGIKTAAETVESVEADDTAHRRWLALLNQLRGDFSLCWLEWRSDLGLD